MIDAPQILARTGGRELSRIVYSEDDIRRRVEEMGASIAAHYRSDEDLLLVGLLKGSFIFVGDLVRAIPRPLQVDFLVAASYGAGTVSSGEVRLLYDPEAFAEPLRIVQLLDRLADLDAGDPFPGRAGTRSAVLETEGLS